jgi:hypothetical protein
MKDLSLLSNMDQIETALMNIFRKFKTHKMLKNMVSLVAEKNAQAEKSDNAEDQFIMMCALYGLSHIFQKDEECNSSLENDIK